MLIIITGRVDIIMEEKRISKRKKISLTTIARKQMSDGNYMIMEFLSGDLSSGGIFIIVEDLSLFNLGEEIDIMVELKGDRFYDGKAKVVRSARIFSQEDNQTQSGFGLMFMTPDKEFKEMLLNKILND